MTRGYLRLWRFGLHEVLPFIGQGSHEFRWPDGHARVSLNQTRLRLFLRQTDCACCGLTGAYFWLESNGMLKPHFNLYGLNEHSQEVQLTQDHIVPRSRGGNHHLENLQLLCYRCNTLKGNHLVTLEELRSWVCGFGPTRSSRYGWFRQGRYFGLGKKKGFFLSILLWCACMDSDGAGKKNRRRWQPQASVRLEPSELAELKDQHMFCPPDPRFANGQAVLQQQLAHLLRRGPCPWSPKLVLDVGDESLRSSGEFLK